MNVTVYWYPKCSTCRKAVKFLESKGYQLNLIDLVETPPTKEQMAAFIEKSGVDIKKFFNTSGLVYKEMQLKNIVPNQSDEENVTLLASNGKLIKRPIVTDGKQVTVGFDEDVFETAWSS